jgi:hypothetical protein
MLHLLVKKMFAFTTTFKLFRAEICVAEVQPYTAENRKTAHWHGLPALFCLISYVANHHLAAAPQAREKS